MEEIKTKKEEVKRGANQFSEVKFNYVTGCPHNCKYCYAKACSIRKGYSTVDDWKNEVVRQKDFKKNFPHQKKDRVMFPSSHDITPAHLSESIEVLGKLLQHNTVLIVSKPHLECITKICETFSEYKDKIIFRFTIGSTDSQILKLWEPNAPSFEERFQCLQYCFNQWETSICAEPLLQRNVDNLVDTLSPYVTETIWIGKANHLLYRLRMNGHGDPQTIKRAYELMKWQNDTNFVRYLFQKYNDNPMIRFKESYLEDFDRLGLK